MLAVMALRAFNIRLYGAEVFGAAMRGVSDADLQSRIWLQMARCNGLGSDECFLAET